MAIGALIIRLAIVLVDNEFERCRLKLKPQPQLKHLYPCARSVSPCAKLWLVLDVDEFASLALPERVPSLDVALVAHSQTIGLELPGEQREIEAVSDRGPFNRIGCGDPRGKFRHRDQHDAAADNTLNSGHPARDGYARRGALRGRLRTLLERAWTAQLVPLAGIEPALLAELDFESSASTSSATGAFGHRVDARCGEAGGNIAGRLRGSTRADVIVARLDRPAAAG